MAQQRWLVKSEPSTYSFDDLVRDGGTRWDGVRNAQARLHLAAMKPGDAVLVYHSGDEKAVIGLAKVTRAAYPDPTADDPRWLAVDLAPGKRLAQPVPLARIKADPKLATIALVRQSRLSVMPLDADAWERIVALGAKKPAR